MDVEILAQNKRIGVQAEKIKLTLANFAVLRQREKI
jgi:hypothetical protein